VARDSRNSRDPEQAPEPDDARDERLGVAGARLEPIGVVERELTRPDGTRVVVEVPVYPPFRLEERSGPRTGRPAARKRAPDVKGRKARAARRVKEG
jgi:hypothetical protein